MIETVFVLHTIGYHCAKYEHPTQKNERGVRDTVSRTPLSFLSGVYTNCNTDYKYMTLTFDSKVILVICIVRCNLQTIGNQ